MRTWALAARESFWFLPSVLGVLAVVLAQVLVTVDRSFAGVAATVPFFNELSASGGRSILTTIGTAMLTVAGTSFSITISVLATTSSTYGPRLVRNFMADRSNQFVLAMFTSTFLYCLVVIRAVRTEIGDQNAFVPTLGVHFAFVLAIADVAVLVYFIHHIASSVQITTLQKRVQDDLVRAVDHTHPAAHGDGWTAYAGSEHRNGVPLSSAKDGYVQQVDLDALLALATRHELVLEVVAMPGTYLVNGDPLVRIEDGSQRGGAVASDAIAAGVKSAFVVGVARTPAQDVRFALQQLVEVAVRGLASGSNDPYTAISALALSRTALLPLVRRPEGPRARLDDHGHLRVRFAWPTVDELVGDVLDSVRWYALEHPSVVRAALDLAERLGTAARDRDVRRSLAVRVRELLLAFERSDPDAPDLATLRSLGARVLDSLERA